MAILWTDALGSMGDVFRTADPGDAWLTKHADKMKLLDVRRPSFRTFQGICDKLKSERVPVKRVAWSDYKNLAPDRNVAASPEQPVASTTSNMPSVAGTPLPASTHHSTPHTPRGSTPRVGRQIVFSNNVGAYSGDLKCESARDEWTTPGGGTHVGSRDNTSPRAAQVKQALSPRYAGCMPESGYLTPRKRLTNSEAKNMVGRLSAPKYLHFYSQPVEEAPPTASPRRTQIPFALRSQKTRGIGQLVINKDAKKRLLVFVHDPKGLKEEIPGSTRCAGSNLDAKILHPSRAFRVVPAGNLKF
eukprot:GEMP01034552.1.p1 GENE.GEMP01034552.1~~GEMP01034552.1.p1  ORF type:complete len:351 (+),score=55.87 GEMP01034552.1:149-1054(+)